MKKYLSLLFAITVFLLMLVSCQKEVNEETPSNSTTTSQDTIKEEEKPDYDVEKEQAATSIALSYWEEYKTKNCYPSVDAGEYYGKDFNGIVFGESQFRIIRNYEEFSTITERGEYFPKSIFDDSVILVICTYGQTDEFVFGYSNFEVNNKNASIISYRAESDFDSQSLGAAKKIQYCKMQKEAVDSTIVSGSLEVSANTSTLLDYAVLDSNNENIRAGSVWLIDANGLEAFLAQQGISGSPSWGRYSDYSDKEYKILIMCHTTTISEMIGYSSVIVNEHNISIDRTYFKNQNNTEKKIIELVAIPEEITKALTGKNPYLVVNNAEIQKESFSPIQRVEETFIVEKEQYQYYDYLELGIYYYESEMPTDGFAYHIISRYDELLASVEKPFVDEALFDENYVVVLRMNGYVPSKFFGIRNLNFSAENILCASVELGDRTYSNDFQSEYCYVVVPKNKFNYYSSHTGNGHPKIGKLNVTFSNYWERGEYRVSTLKPMENYQIKEDSVWIIKNLLEARDFEIETGISVGRYLEKNKVLFIYYGKRDEKTQLAGFLSDENNIYINMSYRYDEKANEPKFFLCSIYSDLLKATSSTINAHIFTYQQNKAISYKSEGAEVEYYDNFYASHYEGQTLQKIPEFTYMIIKNQSEYERVLTQYTSFEAFPVADFDRCYVLAYYVYEPCTGCDSASYFGNLRYANGRVYLDHYKKAHGGGDAMNSTLYFILIDKEELDKEITNVYLIEKDNYSYEEDYIGEIPSEYETYIFSTAGGLKGRPDFEYKIVTSYEELCDLYEKYTHLRPGNFEKFDFEAMCILAVYYTEPSGAWVHGGFKDMRVANNIIYLTKYYPEKTNNGDLEILYDEWEHPTLHFIVVEKTFIPEEITDIIVLKDSVEK